MSGLANGSARGLSRRAALLAPLALSGCSWFDDLFSTKKTPLEGKREPVIATQGGLIAEEGVGPVTLPTMVRNAAWPQFGGNPAHYMGHLTVNQQLAEVWSADIGDGGGYRAVIMAQPVVANGIVYAMDSAAVVTAFDIRNGSRVWRFDTKGENKGDSTNIGGGLAIDQGTLYAVNGLGSLQALDATRGTQRWKVDLVVPARSAPTVSEGRIYLTNMENRLVGLAAEDGRALWFHNAAGAEAQLLGQAAPACASGLVFAGFGSGELAAVRADSGSVVWTDGLVAGHGGLLADFQSIRGAPVIHDGRVFAIGMGGLAVGIDLPTGRRLWERQVSGLDTLWVAGDWIFVISADQQLAAVRVADGRVAWVTSLPRWDDPKAQKGSLTWYGPALAGDRLIVGGSNSDLLAVSPYTGEILGRQPLTGAAAPFPPVVADGLVLVVSDKGRLLALR